MDEVAFNRTLSLHFEQHENDHALIRWLLEAEFLETENNGVVDAAPNRTITDDLNDGLVSADGLPLHISSAWFAHGSGGREHGSSRSVVVLLNQRRIPRQLLNKRIASHPRRGIIVQPST